MNEFKGTPGPWFYRKSEGGYDFAVYAGTEAETTKQITNGGCGCCTALDESIDLEDDARLIAAAPELLAALKMVVEEADSYTRRTGKPIYNWLDSARAAVDKATSNPNQTT